ncbi:hypothetical protein [Ferrimonas sp.]|uniref:hypothetical protein n=1 Tax=Ferrimonas sp. TaxID=2080861 RepID=UPI003A93F0D4
MSVINKMLKDLDQQQRQRILQPNLATTAVPLQGQGKRSWWWLILLASLVLTLVIWIGLWPRLEGRLAQTTQQQPAAAASPATLPSGSSEPPSVESARVAEPGGEATQVEALPQSAPLPQPKTESLVNVAVAEPVAEQVAAGAHQVEPLTQPSGVKQPVSLDLASTQTASIADVETAGVDKVARVELAAGPEERQKPQDQVQSKPPQPKPQVMVVAPAKLSHEQQAQALYLQGKEQGGTDALRQALALDESLHQARVLLAQRLAIADPGEALVILAEASRRWPAEPDYPLTAAEVALGSGAREQAALWLGQLNQQPLSLPMMARRADLARELSMLTLAVTDYRGLANADPRQGRWWFGLAHSLDRLGSYGEAASAYRRALSTGTLSDSARRYIEQRLQQLGDAG